MVPRSVGTDAMSGSEPGPRLLVVDDDELICDLLVTALRFVGFDVQAVTSGYEALRIVSLVEPQLILLDIGIPGIDGFEVKRRLRESGNDVPVIFLTARDAIEDKVHGLRLGADDYITKPFSLEEVIARVHTVLRRASGPRAEPGRSVYADLEIDEQAHRVWRGGHRIELSPTEYRLLRLLMLNAERVLTKQQIRDHVWGYEFEGESNVVETYVAYLRRKLDTSGPRVIHTVRGIGYCLRLDEGS
jgi:two-component system, OmpR family, response regulator